MLVTCGNNTALNSALPLHESYTQKKHRLFEIEKSISELSYEINDLKEKTQCSRSHRQIVNLRRVGVAVSVTAGIAAAIALGVLLHPLLGIVFGSFVIEGGMNACGYRKTPVKQKIKAMEYQISALNSRKEHIERDPVFINQAEREKKQIEKHIESVKAFFDKKIGL